MQQTNNWEKNATIRNKARRILINDSSKYFFPLSEQPLCFHPTIMELGEKARQYILIQSSYYFMQNILINETNVVCKISEKIIENSEMNSYDDELITNLMTVIIDEKYHAYVAKDFSRQVSKLTKIKPLPFLLESSLTRAIAIIMKKLPHEYKFLFEVIAVCIAENSITKELVSAIKDPDVNIFFSEINSDHLLDEGRHCIIFSDLLTHFWDSIKKEEKKIIGSLLPLFISEYLSNEIKIKNEILILRELNINDKQIDDILRDTYPEYTIESMSLINPIVINVLKLLKRSGILSHKETEQSFIKMGYKLSFEQDKINEIKKLNNSNIFNYTEDNFRDIDFLRSVKKDTNTSKIAECSIILDVDLNSESCIKYIITYFSELMNITEKEMKVNEILFQNFSWFEKFPIKISSVDNCNFDINFPEKLQIYISKNKEKKLEIKAVFNSIFFDKIRVDYFLENVRFYIESALTGNYIYCRELPLICKNQKEIILNKNKNISLNTDIGENIVSLFDKQVFNYPNSIAIKNELKEITYSELKSLSDRVFYNLIKLGLRPGDIIAVINDHNYLYIPIILGIMKAKMIFLPLSKKDAKERVQQILNEAEVNLIVSDIEEIMQIHSNLCSINSLEIIGDIKNKTIEFYSNLKASSRNQSINIVDSNLAYIIYTSGSTGKPKGVMIKHESLVNFAKSAAKTFPITKEDHILQFCPFNFDASLADIYAALIVGACICIHDRNAINSSSQFFEVCQKYKISILNLPASFWGQIVQDIFIFSLKLPESLKTVVIGGESLAPAILKQWFDFMPNSVRLLNTYGPSETTIAVTACELSHFSDFKETEKIIGHSFANAELFVLDNYYRLLPIGVYGELYIGGIGVGCGYLNQPKLSEKSFFPNLKSLNSELSSIGSIYKTGDRVRWICKNYLQFLNRNDRQLKIRGFRVELKEIEYQISKLSLVLSCCVLYAENIIAFIIPKVFDEKINSSEDLVSVKNHMHLVLPSYMHPTYIYFVKNWPLTEQGKIDISHLMKSIKVNKNYELNNNVKDNTEKLSCNIILENIWKILFNVNEVHSNSHFLELGGHSLMAMRLIALLNKETNVRLTVREILENPKFVNMLNLIETHLVENKISNFSFSGDNTGSLSFSQEAIWVHDYLQSGKSINYNIAYAIHLKGYLNVTVLEKAIQYLIERHRILRTIFKKDKTLTQTVVPMQIFLNPEYVTLMKFKELAFNLARTPFCLSKNPPIDFKLYQIEENYFILFINHHHIIHDAHSIDIFIKELAIIYESILKNEKFNLQNMNRQYIDYANWLNSKNNTLVKQSTNYWVNKLKNYKPFLLPFRKSNVYINYNSGSSYIFSIDENLTRKIRTICSKYDCTLFVGLLTILNMQLHCLSGETDIAFASVVSTRDHCLDENLIGMFLNIVILRNNVYSNNSFLELLFEIKKTLMEATENCFSSLERINQIIPLKRLNFCHTLVDIIVNYHNFDKNYAKFSTNSLNGEIEFINNKTAKFGLSIDIYDYNSSIDIKIEYCNSLYDDSSIKKFSEQTIFLTKSIIDNIF
jgi:amino acid adenylation domain-containing protein